MLFMIPPEVVEEVLCAEEVCEGVLCTEEVCEGVLCVGVLCEGVLCEGSVEVEGCVEVCSCELTPVEPPGLLLAEPPGLLLEEPPVKAPKADEGADSPDSGGVFDEFGSDPTSEGEEDPPG